MRSLFALSLFASVVFVACKKPAKVTVAKPRPLDILWISDSIMGTIQVQVPPPSFSDKWGVLVATRVSGVLADTAGKINPYYRNWESAVFSGNDNTYALPSAVSVNSVNIAKDPLRGYHIHYDTAKVWNDRASNTWTVTGNDIIPSFTAKVQGLMPHFTGTLPTSVSTSQDLSISFDYSNVVNADSARFLIYVYGSWCTSNVVKAYGGVAKISAKLLTSSKKLLVYSRQHNKNAQAYILLSLFNHTTQTFGGKQFAFVQQREVLGMVELL